MNTTVCPAAGLGVVVLIVMEVSGPVLTVIEVEAVKVAEVAVMVALPGGLAIAVAAFTRPPAVTVATVESEVLQAASPVRFLVLPSS